MSEQDYGLIVTQPGYDAKDCPDRFLAFSSSFQTLKINSRMTITDTIPDEFTPKTITITHNLGRLSPFLLIYNGRSGTNYDNAEFSLIGKQYENTFEIGPIEEGFDGGGEGETIKFTLYLFENDFSTITEENINTNTVSAGSAGDYGLRISKDGYDVKNCTDDQLAFSSSFFTSIINQIGTGSGVTLTVNHSLGYIPDYFAYVKPNGTNYIRLLVEASNQSGLGALTGFYCHISDTRLIMGEYGVTSHNYYYLIFKNLVS